MYVTLAGRSGAVLCQSAPWDFSLVSASLTELSVAASAHVPALRESLATLEAFRLLAHGAPVDAAFRHLGVWFVIHGVLRNRWLVTADAEDYTLRITLDSHRSSLIA